MDDPRELTVLFYFASDNPLAPLVVSEIKAIKDAGFQENTTVLVYFDPVEKGAPTQLFDVNCKRKKIKRTLIGDGADPFVRNMSEDEVDPSELTAEQQTALTSTANVTAVDSLRNFIQFALDKRTAKNYMLILVGHGMIVGNDAFLPDEDPVSAITLTDLQKLCKMFTNNEQTNLRLLGLHSCSMSSVEVAYQLRGTADYMMATQGTMFVNGWPYRQLIKKTLNQVKHATNEARSVANAAVNYDELIEKLYFLCLHNFTDFITAGYSCDLALCNLKTEKLDALKEPLQLLVAALKDGLAPRVSLVKDLVLLAHWDAQSFWSENYTDLWDFCDCLQQRLGDAATGITIMQGHAAVADELMRIAGLCQGVKDVLAPTNPLKRGQGVVPLADNFGSEFQYARGLSIYFPWCEPLDDQRATFRSPQDQIDPPEREAPSKKVLDNYKDYDFTTQFESHPWFSFLETYFKETKRARRPDQSEQFLLDLSGDTRFAPEAGGVVLDSVKKMVEVVLKRTPDLKKTPDEGADCTCPSIKNYPTRTFVNPDRNVREFSITPGALQAFLPITQQELDNEEDQ